MTQRNWLITGVNSGFGREMAEQLLNQGDCVAGTTRDLSALDDLKAEHGSRLWLAQLDVTDTPGIHRVVTQAFTALGRIDVVVSNAGYGLFGAAEELTDPQITHQLETNLVGSMQLVRAALPFLRAQGGGRILQLSSMGGQATFPGGSLYSATKWGIEGFIDSLNQEVGVFGIGCTLIEPGGARTRFRYGSSRLAPKNDAYAASPANYARKMIEEGTSVPIGDPAKMVRLMIDSVNQHPAPKRLALGSDSFTVMHKQLTERLAELESQKALAFSTDSAADPEAH
ncbi:SDR family oxidoreductase [Pseudomonas gingeri]|uniref:SDR family oxidoreductase n=1 Tax=Pseudomonas gingeri TaxID=117681 RepID=UPI0015A3CB78|nr:SDR family oxidoreductase [Pseudomonas gingeri]NWD67308.1 SDR family oxidoreductase [Pseudomonas gingeri]